MFLLAKPEIKMHLLSILMFDLNDKNWSVSGTEQGNYKTKTGQFAFLATLP